MPTSATDTYAPSTYRLDPSRRADLAQSIPVSLANGTYARGAVLGEVIGSPGTYDHIADVVQAAPTGAPTLTTPTGGALASGAYTVGYAWVDQHGDESTLSPTDVTTAAANDAVHVAAVTPPSGCTVNWYMSRQVDNAIDLGLVLSNNGAAADFTAAPSVGAKSPEGVNQTGRAKALLRDACTVSAGLITRSDDSGVTDTSTPAWVAGSFKTAELSGLTAKAAEDLGATFLWGGLTAGEIRF